MYLDLHGIPREGTQSLEDKDYCLIPKDFTQDMFDYPYILYHILRSFVDILLLGLILIDHVDVKACNRI